MTKFDPYQKITDSIIKQIEDYETAKANGESPLFCWEKPWVTGGLPRNAISGRPYNGVNVLLIWGRMDEENWEHPLFLTFNQVKKLNEDKRFSNETCHIRKGSKAERVCFWKINRKNVRNQDTGELEEKKTPYLRLYSVFNIDQVEASETVRNYLSRHIKKIRFEDERERNDAIEEYLDNIEPPIAEVIHQGDRAFYTIPTDVITLPDRKKFQSTAAYYSTKAHEFVHATGAETRCNRQLKNRFGDNAYAFEELIAELGAAFLNSEWGLPGKLQHAEYIHNWHSQLTEDKHAIFKAASLAKQAVEYLDDCQPEEE